jgi:hypothetical protein
LKEPIDRGRDPLVLNRSSQHRDMNVPLIVDDEIDTVGSNLEGDPEQLCGISDHPIGLLEHFGRIDRMIL